jgi:hypothetical protein
MSQTSAEEGRHRRHAAQALPSDALAAAVAEGAREGGLGGGPRCLPGAARHHRMGVREEGRGYGKRRRARSQCTTKKD